MKAFLFAITFAFAISAFAEPFEYSVRNKKTGQITNAWLSTKHPKEYYEPGFGKKERWVREDKTSAEERASALASEERLVDGENIRFYRLPAEFEIIETDLGSEVADRSRKEGVRDARDKRIRQLAKKWKDTGAVTNAERDELVKHLVLDFVKELD